MQILDHDSFEGAQVLAEIGANIARGRAELTALEEGKEAFLDERAAETTARIKAVLAQSHDLLEEISKNHSELVGFRDEVGRFADDARSLIQAIEGWKAAYDTEIAARRAQLDEQAAQNAAALVVIKAQRALLAGEINRQK